MAVSLSEKYCAVLSGERAAFIPASMISGMENSRRKFILITCPYRIVITIAMVVTNHVATSRVTGTDSGFLGFVSFIYHLIFGSHSGLTDHRIFYDQISFPYEQACT